jgi:energy-coupling factor transport system ATP-binding protein
VFSRVDYLRDIGLDAPKMSRLRAALIKRGITIPESALTVEETAKALLARWIEPMADNPDCRPRIPEDIPEDSAETVIEMDKISHIYMPGTPFESAALRDVSLKIGEGSFVALIGHTGSGKSTLIQHMNALIKPTSGRVIVYGQNPEEKGVDKRRIRALVGMVFQYPEHQIFEETVFKDIAFGPNNLGLNQDEVEKRVYRAMEMVGLSESLAERSPFELSGGQRRRVAIAGVIAMQPRTLILDEPTAGLDPSGRKEILAMIDQLHKKERNTVVMVTHSMDDAAAYADRVVVMNHGTIYMQGSPAAVFSQSEQLSRLSLGIPETTQLILNLCARGMALRQDIFDIDILADELAGRVKRDD